MRKVEDYRRHADECREMAKRSRSLTERDMLFNMAATWESLAVNRTLQIGRRERMRAIEAGPGGRLQGAGSG